MDFSGLASGPWFSAYDCYLPAGTVLRSELWKKVGKNLPQPDEAEETGLLLRNSDLVSTMGIHRVYGVHRV